MFSLSDQHKDLLALLFDQPAQLLQDFCKLAMELLKRGPNLKLYSAAALKLQVEVDVIQHAVEALVQLLVESSRHSLSKSDFSALTLASGFREEHEPILCDFFENTKDSIDAVLSTLAPSLLHYHDLEWRFDVQLASRALLKQTVPILMMKLALEERPNSENNSEPKNILLQTDPNNLKHLIKKLDEAIQEASSQHSRRLQRLLK